MHYLAFEISEDENSRDLTLQRTNILLPLYRQIYIDKCVSVESGNTANYEFRKRNVD